MCLGNYRPVIGFECTAHRDERFRCANVYGIPNDSIQIRIRIMHLEPGIDLFLRTKT